MTSSKVFGGGLDPSYVPNSSVPSSILKMAKTTLPMGSFDGGEHSLMVACNCRGSAPAGSMNVVLNEPEELV